MNCEPITCNGNDLAQVCADIRSRGGFVDRLETGVGGKNGNYRVSYFERVAELADATVDEEKRLAVATTDRAIGVRSPSRSPNVAGRTSLISEVTGKSERERQMEETPPDTVNPSNFVMQRDRSDATQTSTRPVSEGGESVKPRGGDCIHRNASTQVSTKVDTTEALGSGWAHPSHNDSIETRLAALQSKLAASGKLKRSKPARLPYCDL